MVTVFSAGLSNDDIGNTNSFYALEMLAMVAEKVYEEEHPSSGFHGLDIPMTEKKPLPFDLNLKQRTHGRPRSTPIDIHALLPCLRHKRKLEERTDDVTDLSSNCKKMRLIVRLRQPELLSEYKKKIMELGGCDPRLVIHKKLHKSDVDNKKGRLSMPYSKCFVDLRAIGETQLKVIQPANNLGEMIMTFARRDTKSSYVFSGSWNHLVEINDLQKGDLIQVWSFKKADQLSFALVKL